LASKTSSSAVKPCNGLSSGTVPEHRTKVRSSETNTQHRFSLPSKSQASHTSSPGQVNHFSRAAPEKIPYAIERFKKETLRVYGVLEIQLSGKYTGEPREYLAGNGKGKYSVADIKTWPWVKGWERTGFTEEEMKDFPHVKKWIARIAERPAVQRGIGDDYALKK
jgi:glutathione S-transferase